MWVTGPAVDLQHLRQELPVKTKLLSSQFMVPSQSGVMPISLVTVAVSLWHTLRGVWMVETYMTSLCGDTVSCPWRKQQQNESRGRSQFRPMAWIMLLNGRARCLFNGGPRKTHQSASIILKPLTLGPSIRFKQFKHSSNCNQHSEEADETPTDEIRHNVFHLNTVDVFC